MDQFNLFSMFGEEFDAPPVVETVTKKEAKKKEAKKKETKTTSKAPSKVSFDLPIIVYLTGSEPIEVTKEDIVSEEKVKDREILEYLTTKYPYIINTSASLTAILDNKGMHISYVSKSISDVVLKPETEVYFGSQKINCQDLIEDSETKVLGDDFKKFVAEALGYDAKHLGIVIEGNKIIIVLNGDSSLSVKDDTATVIVVGKGGEPIVVSAGETVEDEDSEDSEEENSEDDDEDESEVAEEDDEDAASEDSEEVTMNAKPEVKDDSSFNPFDFASEVPTEMPVAETPKKEKETKKKGKKLSLSKLREAVAKEYPELKGHTNFIFSKNENVYYAFFGAYEVGAYEKPAKKEELYEVDGYTLSIVFTKFTLSKDDFKQKTKVTKKAICAYLRDQDYPEYEEGRTNLIVDKDKKLIIAQVVGSRKGAQRATLEEVDALFKTESYVLRDVEIESEVFRFEKNEIGYFANSKSSDKGRFQLILPKIPLELILEVSRLFRKEVMNARREGRISNEMAVQLFYDRELKEYFLYLPEQEVSHVDVSIVRNLQLEMDHLLVMEIHSHNTMPSFFSEVDNRDEKGTRLYCVCGDYKGDRGTFKVRAGNGGNFTDLEPAAVFDIPKYSAASSGYLSVMEESIIRAATVNNGFREY